jgi:putative PIN family toxin of toxin-antitoxin system
VAPEIVHEGLTAQQTFVVLDTNIVLDLWLFNDPLQADLRQALADDQLVWLATAAMQQELAFVLARASSHQLAARRGTDVAAAMAAMNKYCRWVPPAAPTRFRCKDASDQQFIDLAIARRTLLISKDKAVLRLAKRVALAGAGLGPSWAAARKMYGLVPSASNGHTPLANGQVPSLPVNHLQA